MEGRDYSTFRGPNYLNPEFLNRKLDTTNVKLENLTVDFKNLEKEHNDLLISLGKEPKELRVFDAGIEQPPQSMFEKAAADIGSMMPQLPQDMP